MSIDRKKIITVITVMALLALVFGVSVGYSGSDNKPMITLMPKAMAVPSTIPWANITYLEIRTFDENGNLLEKIDIDESPGGSAVKVSEGTDTFNLIVATSLHEDNATSCTDAKSKTNVTQYIELSGYSGNSYIMPEDGCTDYTGADPNLPDTDEYRLYFEQSYAFARPLQSGDTVILETGYQVYY